ncbi:hypothetical protein [Devosia sp. FKR38]|uniref:hypothetical protein n=1 Tax=Devosia sp. FKR38 TaxID=2562312 RepID=UPI0010BFBE40|nr:hypothetical protein [Devosia sp. FKR38]
MQSLPDPVASLCQSLMAALDQALPGQLEAFYVTGSVALGDYRIGQSDLDFIAVLSDAADSAALMGVHADLAARFPHIDCDGIYLRPGELAQPPGGTGPAARDGRVTLASGDERHPVSWLLLADSGIALRGPAPDHTRVAADRTAAMAHSRQNLLSYWHNWLLRFEQAQLDQGQLDEAIHWSVLGALRVHATMTTGHVPSKSAGGIYGQTAFPAHGAIIAEALRLRGTGAGASTYGDPQARAADTVALLQAVIGSV